MGKNKGKGKRGKAKKAPKSAGSAVAKGGNYSVDQLLDRAEGYIDTFEYPLAQKFCQRALEMDPDNVRALETSGTLLLEMDDIENAKRLFGRAIELLPDEGHGKYMYMGQLMTGEVAIQCFQKGIQLMTTLLEQDSMGGASCQDPEVTPQELSSAYCSISEIYLTDECMSDEAEIKCESCLSKAVELDPTNADAFHLFASFWISKENKQKAKEMIDTGIALWLPKLREISDKPETEGDIDLTEACPVSYPSRMNASKLLIELENYELATEILELLLDEEDQVVEVWYLIGWANHLQGKDYYSNARDYLNKGLELAIKDKSSDAEVKKHIEELLEKLGPGEAQEEDGDMEIQTDSEDEESRTNGARMEH